MAHSNASIRALTYCDLHSITRRDLTVILKQYPTFRENFKQDMEITYNVRYGDDVAKKEVRKLIYDVLLLWCGDCSQC